MLNITYVFLAKGDCKSDIHLWEPTSEGKWSVDRSAFQGHTSSVEDLQVLVYAYHIVNLFSKATPPTSGNYLFYFSYQCDTRNKRILTCMFTCTYQWSPTEADVFASCSVDQTLRIWDARRKDSSVISIKAHDSDVNVISWNRYLVILSDKIQISTYLPSCPSPYSLSSSISGVYITCYPV